jgi:hypothetical protein
MPVVAEVALTKELAVRLALVAVALVKLALMLEAMAQQARAVAVAVVVLPMVQPFTAAALAALALSSYPYQLQDTQEQLLVRLLLLHREAIPLCNGQVQGVTQHDNLKILINLC